MKMAKSFNNIFPAPETVYNRPFSLPVGVQPINSAPFEAPGFVARVRPVTILRPPAGVPFDNLRSYTCMYPVSFDWANNCLKGGGTYESGTPCGPVADSVAAPMCPDPDGNLLLDARDSEGVLCSGPNFSGAITNCADGSRPAVDCNNKLLPCGEKHNQAAVNCGDTVCTAVMVSCPNGDQAPNLPYYNSVTNQCGCRGACDPFSDPFPVPDPVGGCNGDQACPQDVRQCLDGQWKGRNPCNNCDFFPCGGVTGGGFTEQPLVKVFVPPNPNTNKDTLFARNENNLSLPLAKLNMTRAEMGDVAVSNMSPTRYAQEIMNQRNIPNYVGPSTNMPPAPRTTFDVTMADGRNQRMSFPNGPICGTGGKQTVFSNSLVVNDWLSNPLLRICTFSNDGFVFGGGAKKPKVVNNPKGDCNLPVVNNGFLAGALPVLSLVAASNFSDVGVGEAPASIPTRLVKNVSEPLPILKDREVSSFLVAKSNSFARNGNIAGLDVEIDNLNAALDGYDEIFLEDTATRNGIIAEKAAKTLELDGLEPYEGTTCDTYYRAPQPSTMPTGQYPAATLTTECVENGISDCPGLYPFTGLSQILAGAIQTGIVYQVHTGSACAITEMSDAYRAVLQSLSDLELALLAINKRLEDLVKLVDKARAELSVLEARKLLLGNQIIT